MMHLDRYEQRWLWATCVMLVVFVIAIAVTAFVVGVQVPGVSVRVTPATVGAAGPFASPGLRQLGPGRYEAYVRAQIWAFFPNEMHVPQGSTVTFHVTSQDVQHGFYVGGTNIHMIVLPGQVSDLTATFRRAGSYPFWCDEYCGLNHQTMSGRIVVDPAK